MTTCKTVHDIKAWLSAYVAETLGVPGGNIGHSLHFADLGLDSAEAALLAGELEVWLGRPLRLSLIWDFPTIELLAGHLAADNVTPQSVLPTKEWPAEPNAGGALFTEYVNPHLGRRLEQLKLDRCYVRGDGCELYDAEGRAYLDFVAAFGALPFGHNPAEIWDELLRVRAAGKPGFVQPSMLASAGELARRLVALAPPGLRYVTFANSGAEAVEAAIKLCRARTGRLGILSTDGSFHGKTLGALSATGNSSYHEKFGAPAPSFHKVPYGDAAALRTELAARPGHYAAVIVEPIQGEGGIVEPPVGYLAAAQAICKEMGVLLIVDEIQTGLGRTGALFACSAEGVTPDVLTIAKALGGGLVPIGACLCTADAYTEDFGFKHSSTFAGGTLACEVGLASLRLLEQDNFALIRRVADNGARMKQALEKLQQLYPSVVKEVRGKGYLLGIRLVMSRRRWPSSILALASEQGGLAPLFASYLLNIERVRVAPTLNGNDVVRIEPPLTATWEQCETVIGAVERAVAMFASGNAGLVLGSILDGASRPMPSVVEHVDADAPLEPRPGEGRFAFILHPLDLRSYLDFDRTLGAAGTADVEKAIEIVHGFGKPAVVSETRIVGADGCSAYGEFIMVGHTAAELMEMSREEASDQVRSAVELAQKRGARIVGLGAFTSVVTQGGLAASNSGVAITAGNSYTAVASLAAIRLALCAKRPMVTEPVVAIVGAAGAIGGAMAVLIAEDASRLILVGNPLRNHQHNRRAMLRVAGAVCRHVAVEASRGCLFRHGTVGNKIVTLGGLPSADASPEAFVALAEQLERDHGLFLIARDAAGALPLAEVVILATSATTAIVKHYHLRQNALVCDVSRPKNVGPDVLRKRPDVLVLDGGVIDIPGRPEIGPFDLERGQAYACMAETMMLALEQRYEHMSLGASLSPEGLLLMRQLASKHGFTVASFRTFAPPSATLAAPAGADDSALPKLDGQRAVA